ncbi:MAG: hypothetical protein GY870_09260, partial [archaeon]|nr:hypothetical protein [archaeon]
SHIKALGIKISAELDTDDISKSPILKEWAIIGIKPVPNTSFLLFVLRLIAGGLAAPFVLAYLIWRLIFG